LSALELEALGCLKKVGNLTPSELGGQVLVKDSFDLAKFKRILGSPSIKLVIKIPFLSGAFGLDNGVIDYVKVEANGSN
jgi:hypothetical protein